MSFFGLSHCSHDKKNCDVSSNTVYLPYMVENQRAKSLPKEITAPGEGGSVNGSPTDSRRKKSLITMDHISEIEDVTF